jgi:hypothetical protein
MEPKGSASAIDGSATNINMTIVALRITRQFNKN